MEFRIRQATPEDAPFITMTIYEAIGRDHVLQMAGNSARLPLVERVFSNLASMENSQYSYRNTLIVETTGGESVGAVISYDGADLRTLRKAFIREANSVLGWNLKEENFSDETSPDELYLDSLMVVPKYRGLGLATMLIEEVKKKAEAINKPVGLLVDYNNDNARALYKKSGFRSVGTRPFAGIPMDHLQLT